MPIISCRALLALSLAMTACLSAAPATCQSSTSTAAPDSPYQHGDRTRIMYLGVFHFSYPDRDVEKANHRIDVLDPGRQGEIEQLIQLLAEYRPTRIAVELTADMQPRLDSLYHEYRSQRWSLPANEVYQLGFRLAERLGLPGVHAVDTERHSFFVDLAMNELAPRQEELFQTDPEWRQRFSALRAHEDSLSLAQRQTLREILIRANSPEQLRRDHLIYSVGFFKFDGVEGGYLGADFVSGWYNRNLRIFRNLQRITESPDDRILFIVGAGHLPILRFVTQHSPEYELVEAADYLARE